MSILSVDNISPIGSGTSVTINNAATLVLTNANIAGIITASGLDISGDIDVDGHTNLDNVSIAGVSTFASNLIVNGGISADTTLYVGSNLTITDKILHDGDTDTVIRFPANDTFTVETAGTERLRIDSAGNMSLGKGSSATTNYGKQIQIHSTSTSGAALHLTNSSSGSTNGDGFHLVQQGHIYHWLREDAHQIFATQGLERMRLTNSGQLLIGNTGSNWVGPLSIGSGASGVAQVLQLYSNSDTYGAIFFGDADSGADRYVGDISYYHDSDYMRFSTGGSERVRIQDGGLKMNGGSYIVECSEGGGGTTNNNTKIMDQRRWMWYGASSTTHTVARVAKASSGQPGDGDSQLAAWIVTYTARSMYGFNSDGGYSVMKMRTGRFDYNDNEVRFSTEQDTLGTGGGSQNPTIVFTDEGSGVVRIDITNPSSTHSFGEINLMTYDCRITLPSG